MGALPKTKTSKRDHASQTAPGMADGVLPAVMPSSGRRWGMPSDRRGERADMVHWCPEWLWVSLPKQIFKWNWIWWNAEVLCYDFILIFTFFLIVLRGTVIVIVGLFSLFVHLNISRGHDFWQVLQKNNRSGRQRPCDTGKGALSGLNKTPISNSAFPRSYHSLSLMAAGISLHRTSVPRHPTTQQTHDHNDEPCHRWASQSGCPVKGMAIWRSRALDDEPLGGCWSHFTEIETESSERDNSHSNNRLDVVVHYVQHPQWHANLSSKRCMLHTES